ncbi:probable isoaspartyl peptidase/L-asparaginase GA20639 [Condylostylus longicornis]|uniref:probable isoaspartyl peptidase/L-asparaginase GA20639 n=1 Tax=Condylostylus longicornis TaxID=2530218 RepID=UPI00244E3529|nr:probable isoaspartyl peptidase/L-asparaginase GA20639 [Condylostylus longicornis]
MIRKFEPIVLVHGGAGDISISSIPFKLKGVKLAARTGYKKLLETGNVLDAVEEAVRSMEIDEYFNAGFGSVLTWNGTVEMDASIMNGYNLDAGCVSLAENILHPISLARHVMYKTRHTYLAGDGLMNFAKNENFEILPPGALVTKRAQKALEDYKNSLNETIFDLNKNYMWKKQFGEPGTVGAVAIDEFGNVAAATSTGGITGKLQGRIGDSPILGGGNYADNELGAVSATGHGEAIMKFNVAQKILQLIEHKSFTAQEASEYVLNEMFRKLKWDAGVITIDRNANVGIYFTSNMMSWSYKKGKYVRYGIRRGESDVEIDPE